MIESRNQIIGKIGGLKINYIAKKEARNNSMDECEARYLFRFFIVYFGSKFYIHTSLKRGFKKEPISLPTFVLVVVLGIVSIVGQESTRFNDS